MVCGRKESGSLEFACFRVWWGFAESYYYDGLVYLWTVYGFSITFLTIIVVSCRELLEFSAGRFDTPPCSALRGLRRFVLRERKTSYKVETTSGGNVWHERKVGGKFVTGVCCGSVKIVVLSFCGFVRPLSLLRPPFRYVSGHGLNQRNHTLKDGRAVLIWKISLNKL